MNPKLLISIPLGINVRDILRLGTLRALLNADPSVVVVLSTPAHLVPEFRDEFASDRVVIAPGWRFTPKAPLVRLVGLRRRMPNALLRSVLLAAEARLVGARAELRQLMTEHQPLLVVTVHPQDWWDWELVNYSRRLGIPTLGVVKSWDNIQRGLAVRPDFLAVWNAVNLQEAMDLEGYTRDQLRVVGPPPFDPYFDPGAIRPRAEFLGRFGLDARRKLIVYATAGQTIDFGDETFLLEELLRIRARVPALAGAQVLCRLHPNSRLEYFRPFEGTPGLAFSFGSYIKTLGWSMRGDEVADMANLLHHADVVLTPGSTVALEAAVFDRPTIIPAFHDAQPEHIRRWLVGWTMAKHYRPIVRNDWAPIAWTSPELELMIVRAIADPSWYRDGRGAIVEHYVPHRDGRTAARVAALIVELLHHGQSVRDGRAGRTDHSIQPAA